AERIGGEGKRSEQRYFTPRRQQQVGQKQRCFISCQDNSEIRTRRPDWTRKPNTDAGISKGHNPPLYERSRAANIGSQLSTKRRKQHRYCYSYSKVAYTYLYLTEPWVDDEFTSDKTRGAQRTRTKHHATAKSRPPPPSQRVCEEMSVPPNAAPHIHSSR
ncbi:unnamed protein product, partial [Ectocarpus sp. 12 AP-2014]